MVPLTAQPVQDYRAVAGFVNDELEGIWEQVIVA
jgi:hypothetical protein